MEYRGTSASAKEFAQASRLEEWVHRYLLSDGNNKVFSDGIKKAPRYYFGLLSMPVRLLHRCCGPEKGMAYPVELEGFERRVSGLMGAIRAGEDVPPMIVQYGADGFTLNDGNHRHEACLRLGVSEFPTIIWITLEEEYREFQEKYAGLLSEKY